MTAWHRTTDHGIAVTFTYTPSERGDVTLTRQELEGLLRTGGWTENTPPPTTEDLVGDMGRAVADTGYTAAELRRHLGYPYSA